MRLPVECNVLLGAKTPGALARAIEEFGKTKNSTIAIPVLCSLLICHKDPVVQEAIIYALSTHMDADIKQILEDFSTRETTHAIVREIISDAVKDFLEK